MVLSMTSSIVSIKKRALEVLALSAKDLRSIGFRTYEFRGFGLRGDGSGRRISGFIIVTSQNCLDTVTDASG